MTHNPPESLIVNIWQSQLLERTDLTTEDGEPIKVIYPGRRNDGQGADLLDAVLATRRGLSKGDIEVHVKSSGWQAHHHHQDPTYNRLILHVVLWRDTGTATRLQNGEKVPILALDRHLKGLPGHPANSLSCPATPNMPCRQAVSHRPADTIARFLDSAGEARFFAKAAGFQADLAQTETGQSLYQGIMGALGYSRNKLPFLELARRLPIQTLESLAQSKISNEECLARQQSLLLGTAGLLPSQRPGWPQKSKPVDDWVAKLEKLWVSSQRTPAMSASNWHLFKVRPNNSPVRRMAAMSHLVLRHRERRILEEVVHKVRDTPLNRGHHELAKILMITANGYWASHFDLGAGSRLGIPTLLGNTRAADISVNVLLPFTYAWGKLTAQPEIVDKSLNLYRHYPELLANTLQRHMTKQLGLNVNLVNSARRQQGLIHVYKTRCSQGRCHDCPLAEEASHQE